jgi:DNA repair protein RadD
MATICRDAVQKWDGRVLILAHVKELIEQAVDKLHAMAPDLWHQIGCYSAGLKSRDTEHAIIVAGIQSVYRKAAELDRFDLILIDEAHMLPPNGEGMYQQFLKEARIVNPHVRLIGLTATPYRMTSGTICGADHLLNHVCYEVGVRELIAQGYLCPLKTKAGRRKADTSGLHTRGGEFIAGEVEALMDDDGLVQSACREIVEQTRDRNSVLIFAASVQHAQHVQRVLGDMGYECGFVCGESTGIFRDDILRRFKDGDLKFLVNVNVLTTGFDAPNIDCVALLRPTNSPGLYYQMLGRGFRLHPDKTNCLVLDFGGNILRHGPVDALQIKDKPDRKGSNEAPAKECPNCQAVIHASYSICPDCGHEFPPPERDKHDGSATTAGVLSGEVTETDYDVSSVYYSIHTKRGAPPDHPRTLRVDYRCGFNDYHSEWVCVAHPKGSYAWQKAQTWWQARSSEPMPDTVERAVELADAGALAQPLTITVRSVTGEKFDRILNYELGSIPPRLDGVDERELVTSTTSPDQPWTEWPDDDIPF